MGNVKVFFDGLCLVAIIYLVEATRGTGFDSLSLFEAALVVGCSIYSAHRVHAELVELDHGY